MSEKRKDDSGLMTRRLFCELGAAALAALCFPGCLTDQTDSGDAGLDGHDGNDGDPLPDGSDESGATDTEEDGTFWVEQAKCNGCGKCAPKCPAAAFVLTGDCDTHLKGACYWQCRFNCVELCGYSAISVGSSNPDQLVTIDKDKCICCGDCVTGCPVSNIERISNRLASIDMGKCTRCGACVMPGYCPQSAIFLG